MKKFVKVLATSAMALSFVAVSAMAGNDMPSGAHFQFNLIGHPGEISGDESNGRAIMIPLGPVRGSTAVTCPDGTHFEDDTGGYLINEYPQKGTKIIFTPSDGYAIIDRDGTDGEVEIELPVNEDGSTEFDVYIRALGKPSQCMQIDGYTELVDGGWLKTGTVTLSKNGRPSTEKITDIFEVKWCTDPITDETGTYCAKQDYTSYSVFDTIFSEYYWDVQNNGTRNVQVRFYPKGAPVK